jgi:hypothetical protein
VPQLSITSTRRTTGLVVASSALLFLAACGGGSDSADTGGGVGNNAFAAYTECLAENGVAVTMPSGGPRVRPSGGPSGMPRPSGGARAGGGFPGGGPGKPAGVDDATWQKAQQACASVLPSGRPGGAGRGDGLSPAYRNCLRDNGLTLGQGATPATGDPAAQKALAACEVLAPAGSSAPAS